jgi:uncharacterized protein YkwD
MKAKNDFSRFKQEIINEHNKIRRNPKSYIPILEKQLKWFNGTVLERPDSDCGIQTSEGAHAYKEAINFLKTQKPISELIFDDEIAKASQDHADDIGYTGSVDHIGADGGTNDDRLRKYIEWDITIAENIDFGALSGEDVVVSLLVDDGVEDRGHRENMFNTKIKYFGVGVATHREYDICTVIDYVGDIISYTDKSKNKNLSKGNKAKAAINNSSFHLGSSLNNKGNMGVKAINSMLMAAKKKEMAKIGKDLNRMHLNDGGDDPFKDDPDAPEGCVSCKTKITKKRAGKKTTIITIKTYTLEDGSEEVITLEETIYEK